MAIVLLYPEFTFMRVSVVMNKTAKTLIICNYQRGFNSRFSPSRLAIRIAFPCSKVALPFSGSDKKLTLNPVNSPMYCCVYHNCLRRSIKACPNDFESVICICLFLYDVLKQATSLYSGVNTFQ